MAPDGLAELRHELATMRVEMATLRRNAATRRAPRARRFLAALLAAAFLALLPLSILAANFVDLNPGSAHNGNINAIADAGITKGCTDAQHYCPNDFVTREQMASFLARTAGLGGNPPVTNALTAVTATNATNAANAAQLGGVPASGYLRPVGDLVYQISPLGLVDLNNQIGVTVDVLPSYQGRVSVSTSPVGTRQLLLPLPVPQSIFGTSLAISSVTVCYSAEAGSKIDATWVYETQSNGGYIQDFHEDTDHASAADTCYTVSAPTLYAIHGDPYLSLSLTFTNTTAKLNLGMVRVVLTAKP